MENEILDNQILQSEPSGLKQKVSRIQTAKRLSTLFIWYGFTIYTLTRITFTDYALVKAHAVNLVLLWIATVSFFVSHPVGQITSLLMLVFGFFARGAFTVAVYSFSISFLGLVVSISYLPLIIFFILINVKEWPDWLVKVINGTDKERK